MMSASDDEGYSYDVSSQKYTQEENGVGNQADRHDSGIIVAASENAEEFLPHHTSHDNWVMMANRVLLSKTYFVVYICIILLSLVTMIWTLVDTTPDMLVFWLLEFVIVGSLVFEVAVKLIAHGARRYFTMWSNWFDICVIVLVLVTLVMYMHSVHRTKHSQATVEEDIGLAVLIVRNLAMILRICIMVKNQRERALENKDRVDFIMLREDMADRESMMSPDPPQNDADDYSDEENPL